MKRKCNFQGQSYAHKEAGVGIEEKNNVDIENECSFDEKLQRKSQQKELNVVSPRDSETLNNLSGKSLKYKNNSASELPGTSAAECAHSRSNNDNDVQDVVVTGKPTVFQPSIQN